MRAGEGLPPKRTFRVAAEASWSVRAATGTALRRALAGVRVADGTMRRLSHVSHTVKSHKVQSVKSCESAGESAETVGGGSVVAVGVGGKDRIVIKKVGYA